MIQTDENNKPTSGSRFDQFSKISQQKKAVFFVFDGGTGLGHLRRLARIAKKLQSAFSCLIVTAHRAAASWFVPESCEFIHLPSWDNLLPQKSEYWGRKPFVNMTLPEALALRKSIIKGIIDGYNPDAIFVDHLPLGKEGELSDIIQDSKAKKYYVTRGILNQTENIRELILGGQAREYLERYYDRLLVACDPKVFNFTKKYNIDNQLKNKTTHVGYIIEDFQKEHIKQTRSKRGLNEKDIWVVCGAGGGQLGEKIIQTCIDHAIKFENVYFDIILGPRSSIPWHHYTSHSEDNGKIRIHKEVGCAHEMHMSANIVVCTGGYNSLVEAMQGNAYIICIPFRSSHKDEQYIHAQHLSKFINIKCSTVVDELPAILKQVLSNIMQNTPIDDRSSLNFRGAETIESIVFTDFAITAPAISV